MSRVGAFLASLTPPEELAVALDDEEFKKIISCNKSIGLWKPLMGYQ
jgi:hypothetical protein